MAKGKRLPSNPALNEPRKLPVVPAVKDSARRAQKIPTYSLLENAIKTLHAQGKVSTPNSLYRDINSTGLAPKRLEYQLAGMDEKIAEWKELYGENGPIPRDELLQFATENNAKTTIRQRVQRPHPDARRNKVTSVEQEKYRKDTMTLDGEPVTLEEAWEDWEERKNERLHEEIEDAEDEVSEDQQWEIDYQREQGLALEPWMERWDGKLIDKSPEAQALKDWAAKFYPNWQDDPDFRFPAHPDPKRHAFIFGGRDNEDLEPGTPAFNRYHTPPASRHPDGSLMTEQEIRDIRFTEKGISDPFSQAPVNWTEFQQASTVGDPTSDLGSPATARKQARWPDYTYGEMKQKIDSAKHDQALELASNEPDVDSPVLRDQVKTEGNAAERLAELQERFSYNKGIATEGMDQELAKLKLILGEGASMTPRGTNYREYLFSARPRVPYDDVPVSELAEQGKLGPAAMQENTLSKLLGPSAEQKYIARHGGTEGLGFRTGAKEAMPARGGLGWDQPATPAFAGNAWDPLFPYTMPTKKGQSLSEADKLMDSRTFLDETDPHKTPHYRATEIPADPAVEGDRGFYELHNMQGPSQSTRNSDLAKAKPKDLIPSMAFNIDPDVQRVAQNDFLRNFLSSGRPALIPHGESVHIAEGIPVKAGNDVYGKAGAAEKPTLIRSLMNSLSAEGVKPDQMTYGPAPGKYAGTHNLFEVSPDAIAYLMKHGIRALTVGGLTGAGAAAMDQIPEQQIGY